MGKSLRQELYQLRNRLGSWVLLLLCLAGCFVIARRQPIGAGETTWQKNAKCFFLTTRGNIGSFVYYYRHSPKDRHYDPELVKLLNSFGLEPGSASDEDGIFALLTETQYTRLMWFGGGLILFCIILPSVLIHYPLQTGVPDWSAMFCGSRRKVVLAKVFVYFLVVLIFSLAYTLLLVVFFSRYIVFRQGISYFLGTLAVHTLLELAVLSIPMYIAFSCPNKFSVLGFNTLYGILCYAVNVTAHYPDGIIFIPFPAWIHGLRYLWQPGTSTIWLVASALVSLVYILVFGLLCVRRFEQCGGYLKPYAE